MIDAVRGIGAVARGGLASAVAALPAEARQQLAATARLGRGVAAGDDATLKQTATQLVSQLFFQPLLAEMRKLPFGGPGADGGRGEEVFGEQLDLRVADAVAGASGGSLKRTIVRAIRKEPPGSEGAAVPSPPAGQATATWPTRESLRRQVRAEALVTGRSVFDGLREKVTYTPAAGTGARA
ncbi:MAG TPA: hypothetical protein PKC49_08500 [Phycisphaerae bacterium]|nr:hypothetical protein [Phycisphaerae bacterium]